MSTYEIVYSNGTISRMRLNDADSAADEVAKWPADKRASVVKITPVNEFEARPFVGKPRPSPTAALASMTPEQLASWKQYANAQVANANSNYGTAMTNGAFSPGTLAWNRDNILNSFKGWY